MNTQLYPLICLLPFAALVIAGFWALASVGSKPPAEEPEEAQPGQVVFWHANGQKEVVTRSRARQLMAETCERVEIRNLYE